MRRTGFYAGPHRELSCQSEPAQVSVIAGIHQSILARDLMGTLGLELVQRGTTREGSHQDAEGYDELRTYFCKLYLNLFTRIGKFETLKYGPKSLS